ncbi:FAD-dependent oxidoreductase [Deinococcus sp.]|uniref:FAD-dependent oxidoreductase n=1 Tax=Deinococcus sp. TaxID=47478 RepID=UPI003CC5019A
MLTPGPSPRSLPQPGHLYDVAVVGAGLGGCELAWRLARAGGDVLLVSQALDHLGNLYAPGVTGAEFAAGSLFALVAEQIAPQQGGWAFHRALKERIERQSGIHLLQSCVTAISEEAEAGVVTLSTWEGPALRARRAVLAVGAFLKARLLIGETLEEAGRLSEVAYDFLADDLAAQGVWLVPAERRTVQGKTVQNETGPEAAEGGYEVRFLTIPPGEREGFRLRRFEAVYALGQVAPGSAPPSYLSVLQDAAALARGLQAEQP